MPNAIVPALHPDGWKFVAGFAAATLVLFLIWGPLGWLGVIATLWCAWFFRDPVRMVPTRNGLVVSPADGLVVGVSEASPPAELEMAPDGFVKISIFLNVFDVHINRTPIEGIVAATHYRPGTFVNASLDKASADNERMAIRLKAVAGPEIAVVQIAGLVARRIVCNIVAGQAVATGERFGLIRFGSRVDLYLPRDWSIQVVSGQRVIGGETVLADATSAETRRVGVAR